MSDTHCPAGIDRSLPWSSAVGSPPHACMHESEYVLAPAARPRMATATRTDLRNMAEALLFRGGGSVGVDSVRMHCGGGRARAYRDFCLIGSSGSHVGVAGAARAGRLRPKNAALPLWGLDAACASTQSGQRRTPSGLAVGLGPTRWLKTATAPPT